MKAHKTETVPIQLVESKNWTDRMKAIREWQNKRENKKFGIEYKELNLNYKGLESLDHIDLNVSKLYCRGNLLRKLPKLPDSLVLLDVRYNLFNHKELKRIIKECYVKGIILKI